MIYFPYFCFNKKLILRKLKISCYCEGCTYSKLIQKSRGEGKLLRRTAPRNEI